MTRVLLTALALAVLAVPAFADQTVSSSETVIPLTVQPAAAPKPALRYLLLPEFKEMNPGNPIQNYMKCYAEQQNFFFNKESADRREKLANMPLKELPARELEDYGGSALRQADWAARLDKPDWEILIQCKTQGIGLLLPDLQQMRMLANALKVRFRAEVALGRFDDADRTAKTMFALSRHMSENPTLIGDLVGIAIAFVAIGPLEEMIAQPGSPNLYWALTNLPSPLIPLDRGLEGERMLIRGEFRDLLDRTGPMSEEELKKVMIHIDRLGKDEAKPGEPESTTRAWLDARIKDEGLVRAARRRLVEYGIPEERLAHYPAEQVLLLDEYREYEVRRDDLMKLANLPPAEREAQGIGRDYKKGTALLADLLVPGLNRVTRAQGRLDQRIALLRCVEALRLYAAEHEGKLPAKLADCPVPVPADPFTAKPFRYEVTGDTAHLRGTPPPGMEQNAAFNVHYEVTIQK